MKIILAFLVIGLVIIGVLITGLVILTGDTIIEDKVIDKTIEVGKLKSGTDFQFHSLSSNGKYKFEINSNVKVMVSIMDHKDYLLYKAGGSGAEFYKECGMDFVLSKNFECIVGKDAGIVIQNIDKNQNAVVSLKVYKKSI